MPGAAKILIVEDDAHIRRLLRATMQRAGHDVVEAADARAALALLDIEKPDVVLLDLGLPDRDGLELIGPIRQRSADDEVQMPVSQMIEQAKSQIEPA